MKIWEKGYALDKLIEDFTVGNDNLIDLELLPYDCTASVAHAGMLEKAGILTKKESNLLIKELKKIRKEAEGGKHAIPRELEDCHAYIESVLTERLGDLGLKIHTARSRNDQVLTALRLLYRDRLSSIIEALNKLVAGLKNFGKTWKGAPMPGYTHMRKAMPSRIDLWAGAFAEGFNDDKKLLVAVKNLIDQCPAGTGAGFGIPINLDRAGISKKLGFLKVQENPIYVQLSRGKFEASLLHVVSQILLGLNRFASDVILFSTPEFGFFRLPDKFCTGSSIMPQKKNPDVLELLRAKYHEVLSLEFRVKTLVSSLPSGYNRDLQLSKEPVLQGLRMALSGLAVSARLVSGLEVDRKRCEEAMSAELFATQKVYDLVKEGVTFREAYRLVAAELHKV